MRVKGGNNYISFVDELLHTKRKTTEFFKIEDYELMNFDSLNHLYTELGKREKIHGLSRLVAGYSWAWSSKNDKKAIDIEIDGLQFQWNQTERDWVNSPNAFHEVGSIHTVQGYDLNYTGVIFGREIDYDNSTGEIVVNPKMYFDKYGKNGINNVEDLRVYIINIYKTIMYRGIKGTFIYACNEGLRNYLKDNIETFKNDIPFRILPFAEVKPYVNSVPLVDITAAAGNFSDLQIHSDFEWIELPFNVTVKEGYFVCRIEGESMNKIIPNGSYCLFKKDFGGSRNGKIVLVESINIQDSDFGAGYTVKEYYSTKNIKNDQWNHQTIVLKPLSYNIEYNDIELVDDEFENLKVIGIFECVL